METGYMQIGEVAERTGLTQRTLRFYEEKGLLDSPTRMEGGFRLYSEQDVQRIEHIVQLKRLLGFTLAEVKQMIEAESVLGELRARYKHEPEPGVRLEQMKAAIQVVKSQADLMDQKIEQLQQLRERWQTRLSRYQERYEEAQHALEHDAPEAASAPR
jgi:DNA-binding transcriptional MerR regulator